MVENFHIPELIPEPEEFTFFFALEVHFLERIASTVFLPGPPGQSGSERRHGSAPKGGFRS
jgi:hypothetical protein